MKKPAPWGCDGEGCEQERTASNGWYLMRIEDTGVTVTTWDDSIAEYPTTKHFCGAGCLHKAFSNAVGELTHPSH